MDFAKNPGVWPCRNKKPRPWTVFFSNTHISKFPIDDAKFVVSLYVERQLEQLAVKLWLEQVFTVLPYSLQHCSSGCPEEKHRESYWAKISRRKLTDKNKNSF